MEVWQKRLWWGFEVPRMGGFAWREGFMKVGFWEGDKILYHINCIKFCNISLQLSLLGNMVITERFHFDLERIQHRKLLLKILPLDIVITMRCNSI